MRVALIEMIHPDAAPADEPISPEGAIEEAVECAKTFCGADAPGFVNGVLSSPPRRARECEHPMSSAEQLDDLITRLGRAAEQLRSGAPSSDAAATLVEDCAALATQAAAELEQSTRAEVLAPAPARTGSSRPGPRRHVSASYPDHLREEVERYLEGMRFSEEAMTAGLEEAMRYSLLGGGKRIRPVLALATARALGMEQREVLPLAGAIELIHTYSLIHDDLPAMDDDALRRGQPTCHVKFGEGVAILAGDGLYAEAFRHLLIHQRSAPERVLAAAAELATATGVNGMVGGQYADISEPVPDGPAALRRLHELKTGRLIGASVLCVLLLTGIVDGPETAPFRRFAAELGVLFQIVDDILDVTGTDDALGKPRGSDERHGKRTYVSEFGIDRARDLAAESHRTARAALSELSALDRTALGGGGASTAELEDIADFIFTRTS